ncbi:MAG: arginine repressor [Syntrophomonadaceae bacterium]|nr:arginine repressor [Syntrophomonadaceae bacterium]
MKTRRQIAIINIISNQRITTQEELCEALRNHGFNVTQATVSRDIRELQLVKIPESGGYRYAQPENQNISGASERLKRIFQDSVIGIDSSENLIVVKTLPGAAQSVASVIDSTNRNEILGTVAGDDTIFVVIKPKNAVKKVIDEFTELLS